MDHGWEHKQPVEIPFTSDNRRINILVKNPHQPLKDWRPLDL